MFFQGESSHVEPRFPSNPMYSVKSIFLLAYIHILYYCAKRGVFLCSILLILSLLIHVLTHCLKRMQLASQMDRVCIREISQKEPCSILLLLCADLYRKLEVLPIQKGQQQLLKLK